MILYVTYNALSIDKKVLLCLIADVSMLLDETVEYAMLLEEFVPDSLASDFQDMLSAVISILRLLREEEDIRIREQRKGRPLVKVEEAQLRFLVESSFTVNEISLILGHSKVLWKDECKPTDFQPVLTLMSQMCSWMTL